VTSTTTYDADLAAAGIKLLSKKDREHLHPRAQVQKLRRIAVRATNKADWNGELAAQYPGDEMYATDPEEQTKLRLKARQATEAMCLLNAEHGLGY
jgi:hypothetical protein